MVVVEYLMGMGQLMLRQKVRYSTFTLLIYSPDSLQICIHTHHNFHVFRAHHPMKILNSQFQQLKVSQ